MLGGGQGNHKYLSPKTTSNKNNNSNINNNNSYVNNNAFSSLDQTVSKPLSQHQTRAIEHTHPATHEHNSLSRATNPTIMTVQATANNQMARPNLSPTPSMGSVSSHAHSVSCRSQLFNSISSYTGYQDCSTLNVSEAIERDCLSVLHKLHDQVNGLQLVQVVVQPLAKLFNPTNLANLVSSQSLSNSHNSNSSTQNQNVTKNVNPAQSSTSTYMMSPDTVQALIARLDTDRDVNWLMEIIGYGLSMPFSLTGEQDSVKDCCTIYCEWLTSALIPYQYDNEDSRYKQLSKLLPIPIRDDPNRYARKMLSHLYNIFLPRQINLFGLSLQEQQQALLTSVSRQAVLCHRVLRTIETIAHNPSNLMENKTWDHLLAFLLTVNDKLLSSPTEPDDIGTQLCDRILGVLFELMLLACSRSLPTPSLWKTFHQLSLNWRHRPALIDHWRRITLMLTKRLSQMPEYSNGYSLDRSKKNSEPIQRVSLTVMPSNMMSTNQQQTNVTPSIESVIDEMSYDLVVQAWYRFLNLIGNPVELSNPDIISKTDEFYHYACASDNVVDPRQHPCLHILPAVFHKSLKGITDFIETFLKTDQYSIAEDDPELFINKQAHQQPRGSIMSLGSNISNSIYPAQSQSQSINTDANIILNNPNPNSSAVQSGTNTTNIAQTPTNSRKVVNSIKSITSMKGSHKAVPYSSQQTGSLSATSNNNISNQLLKQSSVSGQQHNQILNSSLSGTTNNEFQYPLSAVSGSSQRSMQQHYDRSRTLASSNFIQHNESRLSRNRPKCNTILHIFGDWLFSVALIGSDLDSEVTTSDDSTDLVVTTPNSSLLGSGSNRQPPSPTTSGQSIASGSARILRTGQSPSSLSTVKNSNSQQSGNQQYPERVLLEQQLTPDSFEAGQSEAIGILCKLFSSRLSDEDISPVYLSRFYLCLQHCLTYGFGEQTGVMKTQILTSVLVNSTTLLQHDLDGINILIPLFIKAMEIVFECHERDLANSQQPRQQSKAQPQQTKPIVAPRNNELRRACISMLLTLLAYPLHFRLLPIRNCLNETSPTTTFASLRPRLLRLLMIALQTETDPLNMQMLFGGLSLSIHDTLLSSTTSSTSLSSLYSNEQQVQESQTTESKFLRCNVAKTDSRTRSCSTVSQSSTVSQTTNTTKTNRTQKSIESKVSDSISVTSSTFSNSTDQRNNLNDTNNSQSFIYASSEGFIIKSLHVVCHLLINVWKHDTQVSLSALELLTSIARLTNLNNIVMNSTYHDISNSGSQMTINMKQEYKQATKWICDYIGNQCSRPPPAHSKDMHSTIVAAYHCLSVWFYNHPYLLQDQICVNTVMETIELGVSGQKSKVTVSGVKGVITSIISREEKSMKPSSMRVREAAESLLNSCMVRSRIDFSESNVSGKNIFKTIDSDMDERSLFEILRSTRNSDKTRCHELTDSKDPFDCFKYFCDDNLTIFAFMDCFDGPNFKDSVMCLIRSPFGKHCWQFKFKRYSTKSKDKVLANRIPGLVKRPQPHHQQYSPHLLSNSHHHHQHLAKFFPDSLDKLPQIDQDSFVPSLETYLSKAKPNDIDNINSQIIDPSQIQLLEQMQHQIRSDNEKMVKIYNHQIISEQKVQRESSIRMKRVDCEEPQPTSDLEAARLIISQLGYATSLVTMNMKDRHKLGSDLKALDKISVQTCDTSYVYYIRKNKVSPPEILESSTRRRFVSRSFFEFLLQLGQATMVNDHCRWTGKASTSWNKCYHDCHNKVNNSSTDDHITKSEYLNGDTGGSVFDGERMTLYWSDMTQELAFILPHKVIELEDTSENNPAVDNNQVGVDDASSGDNDKLRARSRSSTDNHSYNADNLDGRSISSMASDDASSQTSHSMLMSSSSNRQQQQPHAHPNTERGHDQQGNSSASSRSKKKSTNLCANIGCDTTIIICWLECHEDMTKIPTDWLLSVAETGVYYLDKSKGSVNGRINFEQPKLKARDFVKIFICPMKNGLYKINVLTSFGK